jgi:hypothetical protein
MIAFVRYTSGLGNAALYARIRNATGQFWDFVALTWGVIGTDCKQFLTEYADSDPTTSYYAKEVVVPSDAIYCIEAVVDSTSLVLGYESTKDAVGDIPESGTVLTSVANTTISFLTDLASAVTSYCVGSYVKFTSGNCINQVRKISAYGTNIIGVSSGFTAVPDDGSKFVIINQ